MTHNELAADLAGHLRGAGDWLVWQDMQLGPVGSARPDVYVMSKSYSRMHARAYECKVSRADFLSDVTSGKYQRYLQFASCVVFAVPAGLISKSEVPAGCGLIERNASGWRHTRRPTLNPQPELPAQAWMKLVLDGVNREGKQARGRYFVDWMAQEKLAKKFGKEVAELVRNLQALPRRAEYERDLYEREIEACRERAEKEKAGMQERVESMRREMGRDLQELEEFLGIPSPASAWTMHSRISAIRSALAGVPLANMVTSMEQALAMLRQAQSMALVDQAAPAGVNVSLIRTQ